MRSSQVQSCLPCREKKRKCDRRLPGCSRCQRSKHPCQYRIGPVGLYPSSRLSEAGEEGLGIRYLLGPETTASEPPRLKPSRACCNCRRAKKECDRVQPSCARCTRRGIRCVYPDHCSYHFSSSSLAIPTVNYSINYPIRAHADVPMLIRFFQDKQGLAPFQVERNSLAYYLRSTWISHALADPCLLHATLFSASVQLDAFTGARQSSYTTLYHQFHAVSLVRSRLAMALNSPDDATIGAVLLLAIHGSLQMNRESAEVHRQGLLQIVALRGGLDKLGFDGFLAQVIQGSLSFLAITFDQPEPFPTSDHPQEAPLGPHTLIRFILDGLAESPNEDLRRPLLALFGDLEHVVREACTVTVTPNETLPNSIYYSLLDSLHSTEPSPPQQPSPPSLSKKEFALLQACSISARIIASLLDYRTPWSERHLARLVSDLDRAITTTERATWLKHCPEASIWVAVLGAAMHDDVDGRASFILKENCVASARRVSGWARYVAGRCCYRWLRDRRVGRRAGLVPI